MLVPVGENEMLALSAVDDELVSGRAVRVSVDHSRNARLAEGGFDGVRLDIHNALLLACHGRATAVAQPVGDVAALKKFGIAVMVSRYNRAIPSGEGAVARSSVDFRWQRAASHA